MASVLVWITCRNYEEWLLEAHRSAVRQRLSGMMVEVAHDACGSSNPIGVSANRNLVLSHPWSEKCQYVIFLDADDTIPPNYASELVRIADGDDCVVACGAQLFGDESRNVPVATPVNLQTLLVSNTVHCSALIPIKHFRAVDGFHIGLRSHEDWELWCRLAARGVEFRTCHGTHLNYRRHAGSRSKLAPEGFWEMKKQLNGEYWRA